jgi:hypothetical protein
MGDSFGLRKYSQNDMELLSQEANVRDLYGCPLILYLYERNVRVWEPKLFKIQSGY